MRRRGGTAGRRRGAASRRNYDIEKKRRKIERKLRRQEMKEDGTIKEAVQVILEALPYVGGWILKIGLVCMFAFVYVWFSGLREELAKTAYRDIWINFTSLFLLLCIVNTIISIHNEKRNKAL